MSEQQGAEMAKVLTGRRGVTVTIENYGETFRVTSSTGYRAELRACLRDECRAGKVTPCVKRPGANHQHPVSGRTSVNAWLEHVQTHCHDWHWPTVEAFAGRVLKTYGSGARQSDRVVGVARPTPERRLIPLR